VSDRQARLQRRIAARKAAREAEEKKAAERLVQQATQQISTCRRDERKKSTSRELSLDEKLRRTLGNAVPTRRGGR
jgi:hypothetical protein